MIEEAAPEQRRQDNEQHEAIKFTAHSPYCTRDEIIDGRWVAESDSKGDLVRGAAPYITHTTHLRCFTKEYYQTQWIDWQWRPRSDCVLTQFDPQLFCSVFRNSLVLIAGDSLSWEHYSSLLQLLGVPVKQGLQHQSRELRETIVFQQCNVTLAYQRDDKLQNLTSTLEKWQPDVLILNRGAHFVPDEELEQDVQNIILPAVRQWQSRCEHCQLLWRTSVPGHPDCKSFSEPVSDRASMEAHIANLTLYNERSINYHWYDYQRQNELVLRLLKDVPHHVIDAYYLNVLRPDQHRAHQDDCLHNCYPGKMDIYNQLLLHIVQQHRTHVPAEPRQVQVTVYDKKATEQAKEERLHKGSKAKKKQ